MYKLLSRAEFKCRVFARDQYKCVVCKKPAVDAHHIIERRLWGPEGGYYLENGVSVCEEHHLEAEMTKLSCEQLRGLAGITKFPLPSPLRQDVVYDKWGNTILPNGRRLKGPLFNDRSVQRVLGPILDMFEAAS